jgi:hypothetical protein
MTAEQKLQWIALPHGLTDSELPRLAAFLAPRLRTDGNRLDDLPDFVDWPAHVSVATWHVEVDGISYPAHIASPPPDSALWTALFPPDTYLRPFEFADYADRPLVTFGVNTVLADLRTLYATAAVHGADLLPIHVLRHREPRTPGLDELLQPFLNVLDGRLGAVTTTDDRKDVVRMFLDDARDRAAAVRAGGPRGLPAPIEPLPAAGWSEGERALFFHTRPQKEPVDMPADGDFYRDSVDLHRMIGALGDHPELLRRLGLVVDLVLDEGLPRAQVNAPAEVAVVPSWPQPAQPDGVTRTQLSHLTAYVHDDVPDDDPDHGVVFVAARAVPDPLGPAGGVPTGLAPLPESAFSLHQVDVDGALLKALNLAATVARPASPLGEKPLDQPDTAGLPALRTNGLGLAHSGRAADLQQDFTKAFEHNAIADLDTVTRLHAEDLVRGHRMDVLDTSTAAGWRTLHARVLTATAEGFAGVLDPMHGEGFLTVSLAGAPVPPGTQPDPHGELYVHEVLATWDGWSLSAPRPGAALNRNPAAPDPDAPETAPARVANDPHTSMGLALESTVAPGTLPKLRFGHEYRVRLREVDLAGQGPTPAEADSWLASPAAATPTVPAQGAAPYLRYEPVPAPAVVPAQPYGEGASALRLVVRSDVDQDAAGYAAAIVDELAALGLEPYREHDDRHVAPPKASFETAERHGMFDVAMSSDGTPPSADRLSQIREAYAVARREKGSFDDPEAPGARVVEIPAETGDRPSGRYVVRDTPTVDLPYLPDPLAEGVLFFGLPGTPEEGFRVETASDRWFAPRPFRLRLTGGDASTTWDEESRVLTVRLPQASTVRARVVSVVQRIDLMGILRWCEQELSGDAFDQAIRYLKENRSWLVSPWHDLELVHAVQHPLVVPTFDLLEGHRYRGQTSFDLTGIVPVDPPSTDKIEVQGTWSEWVDRPDSPGPEWLTGASTAFTLPLSMIRSATPDDEHAPFSLLGERLVSFSTLMRREHGTTQPTPHEFGDTKHRLVSYTATSASPFREDFPRAWWNEPDRTSVTGSAMEIDVPSSAPPPPPDVLYVMPTMGWSSWADGDRVTVTRRGGGVRVRLRRGWCASGDGELLGVVTGRSVVAPGIDDYARVSILGADPARRGAVPENLRPELFLNATVTSAFLPLPGGTAPVQVVGYEPTIDVDGKGWFCDLDIDTGAAYQPFLRLALVRYQPSSLPGCHLSTPVLIDIVQTLPDRVVTVVTNPEDAATRTVTVVGPSYDAIAEPGLVRTDAEALARMTVRVQRRDQTIADDELGWVDDEVSVVELEATRADGMATWSGRIAAPADERPQRLLVLEEERWPTDATVGGPERMISKVVYAAHVPIG